MTNPKIEASVKDRLLNLARKKNRPFQELLQYYAMERFLFRLSTSPHEQHFILKGALLFNVWGINQSRATRDIDMLAETSNSLSNLTAMAADLCNMDFSHIDGLIFHSDSLKGEVMQTHREYGGIRLLFRANLGRARIPMQIDFGFGDVITPGYQEIRYPTILDLPAPMLRGYPPETVIAEKLQTMIERGMLNSRIKDYYDVWTLHRWRKVELASLKKALGRTFERRGMKLDSPALKQIVQEFGSTPEREAHWERFCKKNCPSIEALPPFSEVCDEISDLIDQVQHK